jgi:DNA-binding transcriptional regulator YiaG
MARTLRTSTIRTAQHVIALRHTARRGGGVRAELTPVIEGLREELEPTMSKRQAAAVIGISVPTLDKWIARRLLPVQSAASGRPRVARDAVLDLAERVEDLRRAGESRHLVATAVDRMLREDARYQREFDDLYGPGLAAMRKGDFVSAAPGPDFGPED